MHWQSGHQHVGIIFHLVGVLPPCILVPWQFLPVIRHSAMWFHRLNGYLNVALLLLGIIGGLMIARNSMGGSYETQILFGVFGVYPAVSLILAYVNIKLLQIDQHRAWMLRAWAVAAAVISERLIGMAASRIMSKLGYFYVTMPCRTIDYITSNYGGSQMMLYPSCAEDPTGWAAVKMDFYSETSPEQIGASITGSFGGSLLVALLLHSWGVECYLALTTAARDRLKQVSYEKQLARGWRKPGDMGLTPNNWGDLPAWLPISNSKEDHRESEGENNSTMMQERSERSDA